MSRTRIETVDVLRGFALAGILYAHMVIWFTGAAIPEASYFKFESTADTIALAVFGAFVFSKFFSVFSFLFGLSFYLSHEKNKNNPGFLRTYLWRLCLLFLIGLLHHTIWRGDILAIYACLGVLLLPFQNLPPKFLLIISIVLIVNLPIHLYELFQPLSTSEVSFPMAAEAENYHKLIKHGSLFENFTENWNSWPAKITYQLESGRLFMTLGYFILGLYAGRARFFSRLNLHINKFRRWNKFSEKAVLLLVTIGLMMYLMDYVSLPHIEIVPALKLPADFLFSIYNAGLSVFYITGITLLLRHQFFYKILSPLAAMGKMALTNYLLQTFVGLLIFYDFGLGLFEKTSPALNVLLFIIVLFLQLKFSQIWLKHFKQGPVEWLWRGFTYCKFPSNRNHQTRRSPSNL